MSVSDTERFSRIFEASYGRIRAYAARRVGPDAADEVAAETFLVAWRRRDAIPAEPLPWLYSVARNVVLRQRTTQARQDTARVALQGERSASDPGPDSEDPRLWEAWRALSPGDREVLALIAWEELEVREAAAVLGCSAPVFSVRLHRARRRLQRLVERPAAAHRSLTDLPEAS